jgi:enediyne biosynthesis protein E5
MKTRWSAPERLLDRLDARWFQIVFLASFLLLGALKWDFALRLSQVAACFAAGLGTQALWQQALRLPGRHGVGANLSAVITCFGICILVRSENAWAHPVLACLAMTSKYVLRAGPAQCRSHILNPANFAAFIAWAVFSGCWLSPAQWGSDSLAALWFLALGGLVTHRIARWDVSLTYLAVWAVLLAARLYRLDYAWDPGAAIWLQQMSNGSTLLFAFFMISDPMTTPQRRGARLGFAAAVALGGFIWQFVWFKPNGAIVVLFALSWSVPFINAWRTARRFAWAAGCIRPKAYSPGAGCSAVRVETPVCVGAGGRDVQGIRGTAALVADQFGIGLQNPGPVEHLARTPQVALAAPCAVHGVLEESLQDALAARPIREVKGAVAHHPPIEPVVVRQDRVARAHRFEQ